MRVPDESHSIHRRREYPYRPIAVERSGDRYSHHVVAEYPPVAACGSDRSHDIVLTKRELEVLAAMAQGKTNAEIADGLVIAESTVKSHVEHILRKLSAVNRTEAVCRYCGEKLGEPAH